jgi:hypothetical protein
VVSATVVFSAFWTGAVIISFKKLHSCTHEAEWTPFQTQYFSENLIAPGIESGPLDMQPGSVATRPQRPVWTWWHRESQCAYLELNHCLPII